MSNKLAAVLEDIQAQPIPASKRSQTIPYRYKLAHEDDSKLIFVNPPQKTSKTKGNSSSGKPKVSISDKPLSDIQANEPAGPSLTEEVTSELEDLIIDEPVIEPITAESLRRSHRDAFAQL